jgi:hypothetical protein
MKTIKNRTPKKAQVGTKEECLPCTTDFVSGSTPGSFGKQHIDWEASTLPLSYTRQNRIYFSPQNPICKVGVVVEEMIDS